MKKRKIASIFIVGLLVLAGCSNNSKPEKPVAPNPEQNDNSGEALNKIVDPSEIFDKFLVENEGLNINKIELSLNNSTYVYEVEAYNEQSEVEVKYDAHTGDILKKETEGVDNKEGFIERDDIIKSQKLLEAVRADAGDSYKIKEWTVKLKNGSKLYEVELFNDKHQELEYKYDLDTETLLEKDN